MNKSLLHTGLASAFAFGLGGLAYVFYSRFLSPSDFAVYALCISVGRLGVSFLDGGMKISIIKEHATMSLNYRSSMLYVATSNAFALLFLIFVFGLLGKEIGYFEIADFLIVFFYSAAYFVFYPLMLFPLAQMEVEGGFKKIAVIESISNAIELVGAVPIIYFFDGGLYSFVLAVWLGRLIRMILLLASYKGRLSQFGYGSWVFFCDIFRKNFLFQVGLLSNFFRDNQAVFLSGMLFGKEWMGLYAWATQLCSMISQLFIATAGRVYFPRVTAEDNDDAKWTVVLEQIKVTLNWVLLGAVAILLISPTANKYMFFDKWVAAIGLLPFVLVRTFSGVITTSLGNLLLAKRDSIDFAKVSLKWTLVEILSSIVFAVFLGWSGLAISSALMGFVGVFFLIAIRPGSGKDVLGCVLKGKYSPSLLCLFLVCSSWVILKG